MRRSNRLATARATACRKRVHQTSAAKVASNGKRGYNMKSTGNKLHTPKRDKGVYVLDLIIVLAVAAILLCTIVPSYSYMVDKNDINSLANRLYISLSDARIEALRRRSPIRVCPSANGSSCRDDGNWSDGWLIFEDQNATNAPGSSEIIGFIYELGGNVDIRVSTSLSGFVQFEPTGDAVGNNGNTGEFWLCPNNSGSYSRAVSISANGEVNNETRIEFGCNAI